MEELGRHEHADEVIRPNLGVELGDLEVQMGARTQTISEWMKLCPIPPDDPRMTVDAINARVTKMVNHQRAEVDPKYAEHLSHYSEQLGQEPRFTLAPQTKPIQSELSLSEQRPPTKETSVLEPPMVEVKASLLSIPEDVPFVTTERIWSRSDDYLRAYEHAVDLVDDKSPEDKQPAMPLSVTMPVFEVRADRSIRTAATLPPVRTVNLAAAHEHETPVHIECLAQSASQEKDFNSSEYEIPLIPIENMVVVGLQEWQQRYTPVAVETDDPITYSLHEADPRTIAVNGEQSPPAELTNSDSDQWLEALRLPPEELFQNMIIAFEELSGPASPIESVPPVLSALQFGLKDMSPELHSEVVPLMQGVLGTVHGLEVMAERYADEELIGMVQEQLRVACADLLTVLNIEYDETGLQSLVDLLQQPIMKQLMLGLHPAEKRGTHEVKLFKNEIVSKILQPAALHNLLGRAALLPQREPLMVR